MRLTFMLMSLLLALTYPTKSMEFHATELSADLFQAIDQEDSQQVQIVLNALTSEGLSVNMPDAQGWQPLHRAVVTGNTDIVIMLLENGANRRAANLQGSLPCQLTHKSTILALLKTEQPFSTGQGENATSFSQRSQGDRIPFFDWPQREKNSQNKTSSTTTQSLSQRKPNQEQSAQEKLTDENIEKLLDEGVGIYDSVSHYSTKTMLIDIAGRKLIGYEQDDSSKRTMTLLAAAIQYGSLTMVRRLLDLDGAKVNRCGDVEDSAYKRHDGMALLSLILNHPKTEKKFVNPILESAIALHHTDMIKVLIEVYHAKVSPRILSRIIGCHAWRTFDEQLALYLLNKCKDFVGHIESQYCLSSDKYGLRCNLALLEFMLKHGADVNSVNSNGETVLFNAIRAFNYDLVVLLIQYKIDVNKKVTKTSEWVFKETDTYTALDLLKKLLKEKDLKHRYPSLLQSSTNKEVRASLRKIKELLEKHGAKSNCALM